MRGRHLCAVLLALLVLTIGALPSVAADATSTAAQTAPADYKDALGALSSKYDELEKQQAAIQKNINKAKNEKDKKLAEKKQIDNQIYGVRQQIDVLTQKIALLEENILERQAALENQEIGIKDNLDLLKRRLRVMYTTGNASVLGLVLGADDFSEFLTRTQVASRVAAHDRTVIEKMRVELAKISALKDQIQDDKSEVEASKGQMAVKQSQLGQELTKTQDQIQDMSALESEYKANKAKIDAEMKQVQSEVDEIYKQINSVGDYEGGVMIWPVPGYKRISSEYGWRFGGTDYHTGIDISGSNAAGQGIYGKPIVAAAAGKVAFTQLTFVQGRGYGRYIIIDHGGGISSLYGHTSGLAVKVGDTVTRGQTIAYVGSTGWSTGPHLHFEVRVNGKHTPPRPYLGI